MFQLLSAGCVERYRLSTLTCTEVHGVEPTAETPLLRLSAAVSVPRVRDPLTHHPAVPSVLRGKVVPCVAVL